MLIKNLDSYIEDRRGAIHIGAHDGEEAEWYDKMGFEKVLWFEPNVDIFKKLKENLSKYNNQAAINVGIHDTLSKATLNISSNNALSSSILPLGKHKQYHPSVTYIGTQEIDLIRMDEYFNRGYLRQFNFLNIDVQGVELNVIKSFGNLIMDFDYIYTEVNDRELYKGCCLIDDIETYLSMYGFKRALIKWTRNHWGDALYVKNGRI